MKKYKDHPYENCPKPNKHHKAGHRKIEEKTESVDTWLPIFSGFYGTIWESDGDEENELYEINRRRKAQGKAEVSWDDVKWNYKEYQEGVVKGITRHIGEDLKKMGLVSAVIFQELRSPREYNFHNDAINVEIQLSPENKSTIKNYLNEHLAEFDEYIKGHYMSCSGFFSGYSNDVNEWLDAMEQTLAHQHKLGSVLQFIIQQEKGEDYEAAIFESLYSGCYVYAENFEELAGPRE